MVRFGSLIVIAFLAACSALPADQTVKLPDSGPRFQHVQGTDGKLELVDRWLNSRNTQEATRYNPDSQNVYHLFTRQNPSTSQPILLGNEGLVGLTNYNARRRTIVLVHGWLDTVTAAFNNVLVPEPLYQPAHPSEQRRSSRSHQLQRQETHHRPRPRMAGHRHSCFQQCPRTGQPILLGNEGLVGLTNYNARRRTIVLVHGWLDTVTAAFNNVLVPAFLAAEDVNVIVVDWSAGGGTLNFFTAVENTKPSGESVARFINWLNQVTGASAQHYHLVGHGLGAHQVGIVGRNVVGTVAYITALEPAAVGWGDNEDKFRADDGGYTEVIHTNAGLLGYISDLGHVDFYPNGGVSMPGCDSQECDNARSYFYFGESLTSGGFTGTRCSTYLTALLGQCYLWGSLSMGGLVPKTGSSGIYYLETNAAPPFARG